MAETIRMERERLKHEIDCAFERVQFHLEDARAKELSELSNEWTNRCNKLQAEAHETQKRMGSEIKELREQVATLQSALARAEAGAQAARSAGATDAPGIQTRPEKNTDRPVNDSEPAGDDGNNSINLAEVVEELQKSLEKSHMRHEAVKTQLEEAVALVRKRKAETLKWVQYADSLELKIKKMEKKKAARHRPVAAESPSNTRSLTPVTEPPAPPSAAKSSTPTICGALDRLTVPAEAAKPSLGASFTSSAALSFQGHPTADEDTPEPELPPQKIPSTDRGSTQHAASGPANQTVPDSTQGEPSSFAVPPDLPTPRATNSDGLVADRVVAIKSEPLSDGPEILWERATKKSKRDVREGESANQKTLQTLPVIKRESSGSTQRVLGIGVYRDSQESIDLDEGQLTVQTPRKRHLYFEQHGMGIPELDGDESGNETPSQERPTAPEPAPMASAPAPLSRPTPSTPHARSTPLAPLSTNIRRGTKDPVKVSNLLKRGIESLAEDNQAYTSPSGVSKRTAMEPPSTVRSSRLDSLLNSRPSDPSPLPSVSRSTPSTAQRFGNAMDSPIGGLFGRPPPTRVLPRLRDGEANLPSPRTPSAAPRGAFSASTPAVSASVSSSALTTTTPATNALTASLLAARAGSAAKKTPSLRSRPVDQLKMDDFKINPALNNGETFAYNEVVRGRADRANLAGCTDPQCCGKAFRGMATSELDAAGPSHIRRPENNVLMERHLGDDAYLLPQMDPAEKRELWIEARTKELADKYGKHRHRYHRRASPPGFWDADFPTTQDEEQHRAEAEKVERITVQERYREAMRPGGGRWLFRDE
ncbi:MAG: hypothetical protein STHCBS139747_003287 [Sporothrix thermara]